MKIRFRRTLALVLAIVMIFGLAACGGGEDTGEGTQPENSGQQKTEYKRNNMGNKVNYPNEIAYFVENPIEITEIDAFRNGDPKPDDYPDAWQYCEMSAECQAQYDEDEARFDGNYIQISGLKDKEVEDKVNAKLKEHYVKYVDYIPAYRGIKALLGENPEIPDAKYYYPTISMYSSGNLNNILSVTLSGYCQYADKNGEISEWGSPVIHYVSYIEPLNIDLNTGEEIPIDAIICDNIDPFEYLNEVVAKELRNADADEEGYYSISSELKLAGKFTGIKPDQKYSLGVSGITIVFDYETPEFETDMTASTITIPYGEKSAVTSRFYNENKNIYKSEEPALKFFPYEYNIMMNPIADESYQVDGTWVYMSGSVYEGAPQVITDMLEDFLTMTDDEVREAMSPELDEALLMRAPDASIESTFYRNASTTKFGPYVRVHRSENKYVAEYGGSSGNVDYLNEYVSWNEMYDIREIEKGDVTPMTLEDVFREGVDVEETIKAAMRKSIERQMSYENPTEDVVAVLNNDANFNAFIDAIYDDISSFSIDRKLINFAFNDANEIFCEMYGVEYSDDIPYGWRYVYGPQEVYFEDLGYENITLFD